MGKQRLTRFCAFICLWICQTFCLSTAYGQWESIPDTSFINRIDKPYIADRHLFTIPIYKHYPDSNFDCKYYYRHSDRYDGSDDFTPVGYGINNRRFKIGAADLPEINCNCLDVLLFDKVYSGYFKRKKLLHNGNLYNDTESNHALLCTHIFCPDCFFELEPLVNLR